MENKRRKKVAVMTGSEDNEVEVRVSARTPRVRDTASKQGSLSLKPPYTPVKRAQNLATAMLEALIGQLADYVENSHAVEKLIRAQTTRVLRELAHDPELAELIRTQREQYLAELVAQPEILEPLVRAQVDHYLEYLANNPARLQALTERIKTEKPPPKQRKRKPPLPEIPIE